MYNITLVSCGQLSDQTLTYLTEGSHDNSSTNRTPDALCFLDYKTHWTIRRTSVLEENRENPPAPLPLLPPPPENQVSYIRIIRHTPFSSQVWRGGGASYSPKNAVVISILLTTLFPMLYLSPWDDSDTTDLYYLIPSHFPPTLQPPSRLATIKIFSVSMSLFLVCLFMLLFRKNSLNHA